MSYLSTFPIEILECITHMVATPQQMRLWQCGDRILNFKLKNGGVKRTSLCWSGCSWMPWPRWYFTTFDGLVDVEWGMDIGNSLCPTLELNLLPKTLKRLHLDCDDVFLLMSKQNVNMNDLLPILQSLHLSGPRIREENLQNLPSNLIELSVVSLDKRLSSSTIFGDLPRMIQRLTLRMWIVDESEHENDLPSELISLDIYGIDSNFNWFSKLPNSLKTLKIYNTNFSYDTVPPQLEELIINSYRGIPKSLQLPPSLKTLELSTIQDLTATEIISLLPKNLTRFRLDTSPISHSGLQQLPVSLTDLEVRVSATHSDLLSVFPPGMIRISIDDGIYREQLNLFPFSAKLQYLSIPHITDDICAILPASLRTLHCFGGHITTKGASKLPKSITALTALFEVFDDNDAMSHIGHIPAIKLWSKSPTPTSKLNENWISSLLQSPASTHHFSSEHQHLNGTNPHLTSLKIRGIETGTSCPFVKEPFFASLVKFVNLSTLEIMYCGGILCDWLGLIPKTVTDLHIQLTTYPTASQLYMLPRALRYIHLDIEGEEDAQCDWNDEVFQSLPRSLQWFHMKGPFPNVTQRLSEYLPPNLQYTTLKHGARRTFNFLTPLERLYGTK